MTIKLEVGKHYELNNGDVVKCEIIDPKDKVYPYWMSNREWYTDSGEYFPRNKYHELSVKREVPEPDAKPAKKNTKPDVTITISWMGNGAHIDVGDRNGFADSVQCVWMDGVGVTLASVVGHALDDVVNQLEGDGE